MKKRIDYTLILLLLFAVSALYGQDKPTDTRRTAEEQAAFEKTVPVNPAKIPAETLVDPKMAAVQNEAAPTNWKPVNEIAEERKEVVPPSGSSPKEIKPSANTTRTQPPPLEQGTTLNRRDMKGSKTQPEAPKASIIDRRSLNGPKTQPEGEKPKR
ncbi:MAG: hypothetical protein Q8M08_08490 [Bacteroidales bacterium]|nr:hypothetical protein [Bacteroidales bacterium]